MAIPKDIKRLYEKPLPSLLISLNGYEIDRRIQSEILVLIESSVRRFNGAGIDIKRLSIILSSIIAKLAEEISASETGIAEKSEKYYEIALEKLKNQLKEREDILFSIYSEWMRSASEFWKEISKSNPVRECIFLFCEHYRIDLIDFKEHFSSFIE